MRQELRFNRPATARWEGEADFDLDENRPRANRLRAGVKTPSASSAVVETVYRKPRTLADVYEFDDRSQVIDRVPTAVGFHSFDSFEDIKSRHSRYEIELESVDNKLDLDWVVEQIPDMRNNPEDEVQEEILLTEEREQPTEEEIENVEREQNEDEKEDIAISDNGRYGNSVICEESYDSEDSDSCPAIWVNESQEGIRLREKDYSQALSDAKRLKDLNDVKMDPESILVSNDSATLVKLPSRRGINVVSQRMEDKEKVANGQKSIVETNSMIQLTQQAAGWNRWKVHFRRQAKANESIGNKEPTRRSSPTVTTVMADTDGVGAKPSENKTRSRTGPIDIDEIPTVGSSREELLISTTPSSSKHRNSDVRMNHVDTVTTKVVSSGVSEKSRSSKDSSISKETRETLRKKSLLDIDDLSNPPSQLSSKAKKDESHPSSVVADQSNESRNNTKVYTKRNQRNVTADPPCQDESEGIDKISVERSGRQSPETDEDTCNTEGDSYDTSRRPVSNDDVIKAVRGEDVPKVASGAATHIDGFTSWIISGFDSLASKGLQAPIGFLDWSRDGTQKLMPMESSRTESQQDVLQTQDGQVDLSITKQDVHEEPDATILSPRNQSGNRSQAGSRSRTKRNNDNSKQTGNTVETHHVSQEIRQNEHLIGKTGLVQERIKSISSREQQHFHSNQIGEKPQSSPSKDSERIKPLKLENLVEVEVTDITEQEIEKRNRQVLERRSRRLLRDNVSISSIEIPTPKNAQTDDEYSVSVLGLQKGANSQSATQYPPSDQDLARRPPNKTATQLIQEIKSLPKDEGLELPNQRRLIQKKTPASKRRPRHHKRSESTHRTMPRGMAEPANKIKEANVQNQRTAKRTFSLFGRKKD